VKYLSILKDSLREALDSKILYVTLALSLLLILFLGSISFRPLTPEEDLQGLLDILNTWVWGMRAQGQGGGEPVRAEVVDFRQTNPDEQPWRGDYRFTIVMHAPEAAKNFLKGDLEQLRGFLALQLWWAKEADIPPAKWSADGREARFTVTTRGSRIRDARDWQYEPGLFFGALPLSWFRMSLTYSVYLIENRLVNMIGGWVIVLLGVIVTAWSIPSMLGKGTVDLVLSKPVTRPGLLVFKYVGGLTFLFLNAAVAIGGVWLVLGLRTGIWSWAFLLSIVILTFFFAILYSVSTLVAVTTRSTVVCILLTLLTWVFLFVMGLLHGMAHPAPRPPPVRGAPPEMETTVAFPPWAVRAVDAVHAVLPRTADLGDLNTYLLSHELLSEADRQHHRFEEAPRSNWLESVGVSLAFIAVVLGLSCLLFARKDY
jgi:ABC-type transport system involved in multi-copper enzyme maturation permease subunit